MRYRYIVVSSALALSFFIYHFYRTEHILLNTVLEHLLGPPSPIDALLPILPSWMIYSLPESLWVLSATLLSMGIHMGIGSTRVSLGILPLLLSLGLEAMQYLHLTDGRYDPLDVLAAISGALIAVLLARRSTDAHMSRRPSLLLAVSSYIILILADVV